MVVDVHSHAWQYPQHFNDDFQQQARRARAGAEIDLTVRYDDYRRSATAADRSIVFGGKAKLSGLWVDDRYVAEYVQQHPDRLIGFLSLDPTQDGWIEEMHVGRRELALRGIKLMPMYAGFRPDDERLDPLWAYAEKHALPVLLHTGTTFIAQAPLECTLPRRLDRVAMRFPEVRIVMAHLGHPYEPECVAVIRKHRHVYADISALHYRPYQLYNSLMLVQEYGVWDKLLFGSDYPFTTVDASIKGLRSLNEQREGSALPRLNDNAIEALIQKKSLARACGGGMKTVRRKSRWKPTRPLVVLSDVGSAVRTEVILQHCKPISTAANTFFIHDGERAARDGAGDSVVLRLDDAGAVQNRYLHGPAVDQILADENASGDVLWPLTDNQGTVRDLAQYDSAMSATSIAVSVRRGDDFLCC